MALLVWDFDWSLIEENSDTFVITELGADAIYRRGRRELGLPWTQLMDYVLQEAAAQLGRTPADVTAALHRAPLHAALAGLLRDAAAQGADIAVISDANTVYIDTILEHHSLRSLVQEVHTNPAEWRGTPAALRVAPYHTAPHGCRHCPPNLCKGKVLAELLRQRAAAGRQYGRVLYVGDGRGDFCPSQLLLHGGFQAAAPCGAAANRVFAREAYPDGLPCSLWVMLRTERADGAAGSSGGSNGASGPAGGAAAAAAQAVPALGAAADGGADLARVVPWSTPEQLAGLLRRELRLKG